MPAALRCFRDDPFHLITSSLRFYINPRALISYTKLIIDCVTVATCYAISVKVVRPTPTPTAASPDQIMESYILAAIIHGSIVRPSLTHHDVPVTRRAGIDDGGTLSRLYSRPRHCD